VSLIRRNSLKVMFMMRSVWVGDVP